MRLIDMSDPIDNVLRDPWPGIVQAIDKAIDAALAYVDPAHARRLRKGRSSAPLAWSSPSTAPGEAASGSANDDA